MGLRPGLFRELVAVYFKTMLLLPLAIVIVGTLLFVGSFAWETGMHEAWLRERDAALCED